MVNDTDKTVCKIRRIRAPCLSPEQHQHWNGRVKKSLKNKLRHEYEVKKMKRDVCCGNQEN